MNSKKSLKTFIFDVLLVVEGVIRFFMIALVILFGQYANAIAETFAKDGVFFNAEFFRYTGGLVWEFFAFLFVLSSLGVKLAYNRLSGARAFRVLIKKQERRSGKRRVLKKFGEYRKPNFVVTVFDIVPAFLN